MPPASDAQSSTPASSTAGVDLHAIVVALAALRIASSQGAEWLLDCPRHRSQSGRSLRVNASKPAWWCHGCRTGAAGDAAAFTLARWLLPRGTPDREVFDALRRLKAADGR